MTLFVLIYKDTRPHRLAARTSPFHGGNRGSIPLGVTEIYYFSIRTYIVPHHYTVIELPEKGTAQPIALYQMEMFQTVIFHRHP